MEKKKKKKNILFIRLNVLFFLVFLFFSVLILRIGYMQIVKGEEYRREVEASENIVVKKSVPRGVMIDRYGRPVVENEPLYELVYTKTQSLTQTERLDMAKEISTLIDVDTEKAKERDLKDFYILTRFKDLDEAYKKKLTNEQRKKLSDKEKYNKLIDVITEDELASLNEEDRQLAIILAKMQQGYAQGSQVIKRGLTNEEVARISEKLGTFSGIEVQMDSNRKYPYGEMFRSFLGTIKEIPKEQRDYYETRGYSLNDKVGQSYIEQYYEDVLSGKKSEEIYSKVNKEGKSVGTKPGQSGSNLMLTIDMDLQQRVEQSLSSVLAQYGVREGYVVMMNPKTGEVLALAGKKARNGKYEDAAIGTIYNSFEMGSTVKGATILTGYQTGAIQPGTVLYDAPIKIAGTPEKKSYKNFGSISDVKALEVSSNVYMFKVTMALAGVEYRYGAPLPIKEEAYDLMRKHFNEFGLGVPTGIDLPNEATGYRSDFNPKEPGKLIDLSIGQLDTYTPMQMAQYVSTIANGGYRVKPQLVKQITQPAINPNDGEQIIFQHNPVVLNKINVTEEELKQVQRGFYLVYHGSQGTARSFANKPYDAAGKTGTAQTFVNGSWTENSTLIGYAPFEDPEVAFSIVLPYRDSKNANQVLGMAILDAYFELKEARNGVQGIPAKSDKEPIIDEKDE